MLKFLLSVFCLAVLLLSGCASPVSMQRPGPGETANVPVGTTALYPSPVGSETIAVPETPPAGGTTLESTQTATQMAATQTSIPASPPIDPRPTQDQEQLMVVEAARLYLAREIGVDPAQISLIGINPVDVTQLGPACIQAMRGLTGERGMHYLVVFQVAQNQYQVISDRSGKRLAICPGPVPGERIPLGRTAGEDEIVAAAKENLARRLDIPLDQVTVTQVDQMEWEDDSLGCPRPLGKTPDRAFPRLISGYRIVLEANGIQYEYHSGVAWLVFCGAK